MNCAVCGAGAMEFAFSLERDSKSWQVYECQHCTVRSVIPIPSDGELRAMYANHYSGNKERLDELLDNNYGRLSFPRQWGIIKKLSGKETGRILDFGCGGGHFLDRVSKKWTRCGVDISNEARAIATQKGISTFESLENMGHWEEWFDVVTMFATIEHLPRPRETVKQLAKLLKPNGLFAVMTGDSDTMRASLNGRGWAIYAPPGHLHYFTAQALDYLMASLGFRKILHLYTDGGTAKVKFIPSMLLRVGLEIFHRLPKLNTIPLFDIYYGYYTKG